MCTTGRVTSARPVATIWRVLDGTSLGVGGTTARDEPPSAPASNRATAAATPLPDPRREIWFRRRISLRVAVRELVAFRELILTLAERDLRVRYKQAVLGILWAVFTPVVTMIAFTFIFTKVAHINTHAPGVPYAIFAYMGLLPWTLFSSSLTSGGMSLVSNVALLNKLYCPREVFPIAAIIDATFDALVATLVLGILFVVLGFAPHIEILWLPVLLIPLFAFTLGVTLAVSVVTVFMRDLRLVLPLIVQVGMYATPVIYSPATLFHDQALLLGYSALNPLVPVLDGLRRTILLGQNPNWLSLGIGTATSLLYLLGGFKLFKRLETGIADVA